MLQKQIYSLGVTLFVLAFCIYPYNLHEIDHNDYEEIKNAIEKNELIFPNEDNEYSQRFINFLEHLLNKDINKRYNIEQAMNDKWVKRNFILLDEKEKLFNSGKFLIQLLVDGIEEFKNYIEDIKN